MDQPDTHHSPTGTAADVFDVLPDAEKAVANGTATPEQRQLLEAWNASPVGQRFAAKAREIATRALDGMRPDMFAPADRPMVAALQAARRRGDLPATAGLRRVYDRQGPAAVVAACRPRRPAGRPRSRERRPATRRRAAATRSSARSGDSGDPDPAGEPPAGLRSGQLTPIGVILDRYVEDLRQRVEGTAR
jgi:hypothetical protein